MLLTLHIGSHKAGSSAIQAFCVANQQLLLKHGILYPLGLFETYPSQHSELARFLHPDRGADLAAKCAELAAKAEAAGAIHVLLSGEDLCAGANDDMVQSLEAALSRHFQPIRVVIVLRDKAGYLLSHLKHMLRHGGTGVDFKTFDEATVFRPVEVVNRWTHFFGDDNMTVMPFRAPNGEPLMKRFFSVLFGLELGEATVRKYGGVNESFDLLSSFLVNDAVKPLRGMPAADLEAAYGTAFAAATRRLPFIEAAVASLLDELFPNDNSWAFASMPELTAEIPRPRALSPDEAVAYLQALGRFIEDILAKQQMTTGPAAATALTRAQVHEAYRVLLDRPPESDEAVTNAMGYKTLVALRAAVLDSQEYRARNPQPEKLNNIPLSAPAIRIAGSDDPATLAKLFAHIQERWTALGETAPHWSVLSAPQYEGQLSEETTDNFYATATAEGEILERILARANREAANYADCFEFGCGVGRMTLQLGKMFPKVTGCDISKSHLELARQAATRRGAVNVRFQLASTTDFGMPGTFDFWYSRIVLQHNPPPMIEAILARALHQLRPGGLAVFQVPTYAIDYSFEIDRYLQTMKDNADVEMHCIPQARVFALAEAEGCRILEVREDNSVDIPRYWVSNNFVVEKAPADQKVIKP